MEGVGNAVDYVALMAFQVIYSPPFLGLDSSCWLTSELFNHPAYQLEAGCFLGPHSREVMKARRARQDAVALGRQSERDRAGFARKRVLLTIIIINIMSRGSCPMWVTTDDEASDLRGGLISPSHGQLVSHGLTRQAPWCDPAGSEGLVAGPASGCCAADEEAGSVVTHSIASPT